MAENEADGTATTPARSDHVHAHGDGYLPDAHHDQAHDHTGAGDGTALAPASLAVSGGPFALAGDLSPATLTASQNDYSPTGLATASVLRLATDATRTLTGLAGGADGRVLLVVNVGAQNLVLADESSSSSAANRFGFDASVTLPPEAAATLWYDGTAARWRVIGLGKAAAAASGLAADSLWGAKGDLAVATANDTATRLAAGSNGQLLSADSAQATGLAWIANPVTAHTALPDAHHAQGHDHTTADGSGVLSDDEHDGFSQYVNLGGDPTTPASNRIRLYSKDNGSGVSTLYYRSESGDVYELPDPDQRRGRGRERRPVERRVRHPGGRGQAAPGGGAGHGGDHGRNGGGAPGGGHGRTAVLGVGYRRAGPGQRERLGRDRPHGDGDPAGRAGRRGAGHAGERRRADLRQRGRRLGGGRPDRGRRGGSVATDTLWNAAGDLAVGSGADTAARLGIGSTAQHLAVRAGTPAWEYAYSWVSFVIDGGGSAITTGQKGHLVVPAGTIVEARLLADQSGSLVVDLWKDTYAAFPPAVGDTITASAKPTLSGVAKSQDTSLTGWTTACADGDVLAVNVDSAATVTRCTLALRLRRG